ncbi:MAG: hypothetical protein M1840_004871 [Geoglossum simile]|nr:MAG: hypothetical protein M1840_004871 [Geoglossum simile]
MSRSAPRRIGQDVYSLGHAVQPVPHFHRQQSLESVLNFNYSLLSILERARAEPIFSQVLESLNPTSFTSMGFDPILLLRLSLEHNPSEEGRANFLNFILRNYDEDAGNTIDPITFTQVLDRLEQRAVRGWAVKTPQPTAHLTPAGDGVPHNPTLDRISNLRAACLARDGHRCIVTGYFDAQTASNRNPMVDDTGLAISEEETWFTEVTHIIPHALGETTHENSPLGTEKAAFWGVMKLFHPHAERLLDEELESHTYLFKKSPARNALVPGAFRSRNDRGQVRFIGSNGTDLPDRNLLALYRVCAIILGLSGSGEYIDRVLHDEDTIHLGGSEKLEQGALDLVAMVSWRLALY